MKYQKPQLTANGSAIRAVQSHMTKGQIQPFDGSKLTDSAYEADE